MGRKLYQAELFRTSVTFKKKLDMTDPEPAQGPVNFPVKCLLPIRVAHKLFSRFHLF